MVISTGRGTCSCSRSWPGDVQTAGEGEFDPALIEAVEAMGKRFQVVDRQRMTGGRVYLALAAIDPATGRLEGACSGEFYGGAEGY